MNYNLFKLFGDGHNKTQGKLSFASKLSKKLYKKRNHAMVGLSPFNSYYSVENIKNTIEWARGNFKSFNVFLPTNLSVYTLLALGYDLPKAEKKVKRQDQYLYNKLVRAWESLELDANELKSVVCTMDDLLNNNERFLGSLEKHRLLYENDKLFSNICDNASIEVLRNYFHLDVISEETLKRATQYILYEMPLFLETADILGHSSSVFVYHNMSSYIEKLFKYGTYASKNQGYLEYCIIQQDKYSSVGHGLAANSNKTEYVLATA